LNKTLVLFPKITEIFLKRASLFLHGNRDGVSLNFLQKNTNGIFLSTEDFMINSKLNYSDLLKDLSTAKILYKKVLEEHRLITSERWNAELELFSLLYVLVKSKKPQLLVETGVANGVSTSAIMSALDEDNSSGSLNSFDVLPETKEAYLGKGKWNFHLLDKKRTHKQLSVAVGNSPLVDIWLHDSNHGYRWQKFEYLLALSRLKDDGVLISDDIDASPAWGELAKSHFRESYIIFDSRKFVGIAFK
jgi:predicted O-methyltransferase YrrM